MVRLTVSFNMTLAEGDVNSGPKVIKLYSCSTQLSTKFIMLINVKMPTIVGTLTFISRINNQEKSLFFSILVLISI